MEHITWVSYPENPLPILSVFSMLTKSVKNGGELVGVTCRIKVLMLLALKVGMNDSSCNSASFWSSISTV